MVQKVAICIPVHNALPHLKKLINSIQKNTPEPYSLLICNDRSDEATTNYINSLPTKRVVTNKIQQWFTRSSNSLLILSYLAGADYTFLLNSDIIMPPGWVQNLLMPFKDDKVFLVGSVLGSGKHLRSTRFPDYVTGHCWCIRTSYMKEIGILDETMPHIESDKEYCCRANRLGYKTLIDTKTKVYHAGGASWKRNIETLDKIPKGLLSFPRPINMLKDERLLKRLKDFYK